MSSASRSFEEFDRNELPLPLAFLASCLLCMTIFVALYVWIIDRRPQRPPPPVPVRVVLVQLPTPPPPPPPVAPPPDALPPPPPPVVVPVAPKATIALPPTTPAPPVPPRKEPPHRHAVRRAPVRLLRPIEPTPAPIDMAPTAPTVSNAPPAPRPAAADPAARETLEGRIKQAIQRTQRYPESAKMMSVHGTALVGFAYRDRSAFDIRIIRSSSSSILDAEAVRDVRDAVLPPPGEMAGKTLSLEVAVVFDLVSDDD